MHLIKITHISSQNTKHYIVIISSKGSQHTFVVILLLVATQQNGRWAFYVFLMLTLALQHRWMLVLGTVVLLE